ncbi:hypothetical protein [Deinococcus sp.]|uniref:hypothetical protein n=1 Tax=Deinococcus sp. TaxID=47478 RepID=UPI003B5C3B22
MNNRTGSCLMAVMGLVGSLFSGFILLIGTFLLSFNDNGSAAGVQAMDRLQVLGWPIFIVCLGLMGVGGVVYVTKPKEEDPEPPIPPYRKP